MTGYWPQQGIWQVLGKRFPTGVHRLYGMGYNNEEQSGDMESLKMLYLLVHVFSGMHK